MVPGLKVVPSVGGQRLRCAESVVVDGNGEGSLAAHADGTAEQGRNDRYPLCRRLGVELHCAKIDGVGGGDNGGILEIENGDVIQFHDKLIAAVGMDEGDVDGLTDIAAEVHVVLRPLVGG